MISRKKLTALASLTVLSYVPFVGTAIAATDKYCKENADGFFLGFPTWYKYLNPEFVGGECKLTMAFPQDLSKVALALVEILLRFGGLLAVGFAMYGGFKYITSQGEPDKTKNAKQTIQNSVIGLVITTIATLAVAFIGKQFIS